MPAMGAARRSAPITRAKLYNARMGNVLRVLGIVLASMLLGLVGLFLLLFTICGGLKDSDGGAILAVCLLLMAGSIGLIVFLGRGIVATRAASRGLAVPPAGAARLRRPIRRRGRPLRRRRADDHTGVALRRPRQQRPPRHRASPAPRALAGSDRQALVGLRLCLAILILLSLGSMAFNFVNFSRFGSSVAIQLILRSILALVPPAVLVAVSIRNPPAGGALDAVAGFGIASILFRIGYLAFAGVFVQAPAGQHPVHHAGADRRLQRARAASPAGALPAQPRRTDERGHPDRRDARVPLLGRPS